MSAIEWTEELARRLPKEMENIARVIPHEDFCDWAEDCIVAMNQIYGICFRCDRTKGQAEFGEMEDGEIKCIDGCALCDDWSTL